MSMATLERAVLAGAKDVLHNRGLRMKDIMEWSTGDITPQDGEVCVRVPDPGVNVCVKIECDKRKANNMLTVSGGREKTNGQ
jgi:hypothetical protein